MPKTGHAHGPRGDGGARHAEVVIGDGRFDFIADAVPCRLSDASDQGACLAFERVPARVERVIAPTGKGLAPPIIVAVQGVGLRSAVVLWRRGRKLGVRWTHPFDRRAAQKSHGGAG